MTTVLEPEPVVVTVSHEDDAVHSSSEYAPAVTVLVLELKVAPVDVAEETAAEVRAILDPTVITGVGAKLELSATAVWPAEE